MSTTDPSACFPFPDPDLAAHLAEGQPAALAPPANTDAPSGHDAPPVPQVAGLNPRDLEETLFATQLLAAHVCALQCFGASEQVGFVSPDASRLRRDAILLQRSMVTVLDALHGSQARPMLADASGLPPRPTVPVMLPPQAAQQPDGAAPPPAAEESDDATPQPPGDPLEGNPSLQRLRDNWDTLPRWEDMTVDQRREAFGYTWTPQPDAGSGDGPDPPPPA